MSEKLPSQPQNEEVDLGQLFNAIGRLFEKLFNFIGSIFKGLFSAIIFGLKPLANNFKLIAIILMSASVLGFIGDKLKDPVYVSDMLVKPYYDSKYQLANNVNYFNALISAQNYAELSNIFEIDSATTAELLGFEIEIGPETQNDLLKEYDDYKKSLDSTLAIDVTYDDFIENRDILAGSIFSIKAKAINNDIFPSLEKGFVKTLMNEYSVELKERTDSIRKVKKQTYIEELERIDRLQETYLEIKKNESARAELNIGIEGALPLVQEKTKTKEFELFQEELKVRGAIRALEEEEIAEGEFFDILSSFEKVGSQESDFKKKYVLLFPAIALLIMIFGYTMFKMFKYIRDYE